MEKKVIGFTIISTFINLVLVCMYCCGISCFYHMYINPINSLLMIISMLFLSSETMLMFDIVCLAYIVILVVLLVNTITAIVNVKRFLASKKPGYLTSALLDLKNAHCINILLIVVFLFIQAILTGLKLSVIGYIVLGVSFVILTLYKVLALELDIERHSKKEIVEATLKNIFYGILLIILIYFVKFYSMQDFLLKIIDIITIYLDGGFLKILVLCIELILEIILCFIYIRLIWIYIYTNEFGRFEKEKNKNKAKQLNIKFFVISILLLIVECFYSVSNATFMSDVDLRFLFNVVRDCSLPIMLLSFVLLIIGVNKKPQKN